MVINKVIELTQLALELHGVRLHGVNTDYLKRKTAVNR